MMLLIVLIAVAMIIFGATRENYMRDGRVFVIGGGTVLGYMVGILIFSFFQ